MEITKVDKKLKNQTAHDGSHWINMFHSGTRNTHVPFHTGEGGVKTYLFFQVETLLFLNIKKRDAIFYFDRHAHGALQE